MRSQRNSAGETMAGKLTQAPASTANPTLRTSTSTSSSTKSPSKSPRPSGPSRPAISCHGRATSTRRNPAPWLAVTMPGSTAVGSMPRTTAWTVTLSRIPTSLPSSTRPMSSRAVAQSPTASSWPRCHSSRGCSSRWECKRVIPSLCTCP